MSRYQIDFVDGYGPFEILQVGRAGGTDTGRRTARFFVVRSTVGATLRQNHVCRPPGGA